MSETLKSIIDSYRSGLLSTTNIQVFEKKLSDETIKFPKELMVSLILFYSLTHFTAKRSLVSIHTLTG